MIHVVFFIDTSVSEELVSIFKVRVTQVHMWQVIRQVARRVWGRQKEV
jgi:hypothetical protein